MTDGTSTQPALLLTVPETAKALRQSRSTIYRKIHEGQLAAVRLGTNGPLRIAADDLGQHLRPAQVSESSSAFRRWRAEGPAVEPGTAPSAARSLGANLAPSPTISAGKARRTPAAAGTRPASVSTGRRSDS
jgi:excisionase family DNA binding protein